MRILQPRKVRLRVSAERVLRAFSVGSVLHGGFADAAGILEHSGFSFTPQSVLVYDRVHTLLVETNRFLFIFVFREMQTSFVFLCPFIQG